MNPIKNYYNSIVDRMKAEFSMSKTGHPGDTGSNREILIQNFLNKHLVSRLSANIGGSILGYEQQLSGQIDIVVKNDLSPRFDENDKSFFLAEGVAAAISVKSNLKKDSLWGALGNIASIPQLHKDILTFKALRPHAYDEYVKFHPRLFIFAFEGVKCETATEHVSSFYDKHPNIPPNRRPFNIVVNGKYFIQYSPVESKTYDGTLIPPNTFYACPFPEDFRGYPLVNMINSISSCLSWLSWMDLNSYKYFNSSYWNK